MTDPKIIRDRNDAIRKTGDFGPDTQNPLMISSGVLALGSDKLAALYAECMTYTEFEEMSPELDLHDFGVLTSAGVPVWFKFDRHPDDPTLRVVTFFLPEEN